MVEDGPVLVPLEDLVKKPYRELSRISEPSDESVESRIRQLKSLGIEGLEFERPTENGKAIGPGQRRRRPSLSRHLR